MMNNMDRSQPLIGRLQNGLSQRLNDAFTNSAVYFSTLHSARNKHDNDHSRLEINGYGGHGFGLCSQFPDRTVQICSWLDRASIWIHRLVSGEN